jgi:hypothetical protein
VVMTKFSRALLGLAIVVLSVVLLLLVGWLLGNGSLFNS